MIDVRRVHRRFGEVHAVRGVSLHVDRGEAVGLLGPNGAGKTTTIRMITGALPPTSGAIAIDGRDTLRASLAARAQLGFLPENAPAYPEMRVEECLRFCATIRQVPRAKRAAAVDRALERCWLGDVRTRRAGELSKGYRQRLGLAAALVHDPPCLILDEPTSGLDPAQIAQTRMLIRELAQGRAVIFSSHILAEVEKTCDRVIIIVNGEVRAERVVGATTGATDRCLVQAQANSDETLREAIERDSNLRIQSIERVSDAEPRWRQAIVRLREDASVDGRVDLRERIAAACAQAGLLVRELRRASTTLEDQFLEILRETPAADEEAPSWG